MKRFLQQGVSNRTAFQVIGVILVLLALFVGWRVQAIYARHDGFAERAKDHKPMRVPLFVDPDQVHYRTRFNFTFDPAEALAELREAEGLEAIAGSGPDFERVVNLLHWTSAQWEPGRPDPYPPFDAKIILQEIRAGRTGGFCAQYNYVFVQAVASLGIPARYVTVVNHEVTEVWIEELDKWVCFDPLHDAYFTDARGTPLSVYEMSAALRAGEPMTIVGKHRTEDEAKHLQKFRSFAMWLKNDLASSPMNFADIPHHKVHYVEPGGDLARVRDPELYTSSVGDLYFDPTRQRR